LDLYFQNYKHLKFDVFQEDWTKKNWKLAVGTFADSYCNISDYIHSMFRNGVQGPMLNKTRHKVFQWWPLSPG